MCCTGEVELDDYMDKVISKGEIGNCGSKTE